MADRRGVWHNGLASVARQPGVHFALLGGALFLLRAGLAPAPPPAPQALPAAVAAVAARPEALRTGGPVAGRPAVPPSPALSDDELLYREALKLGLDHERPVERRLVQNMRFLEVAPRASDRALYRQAVAIGFQRTDPVVRRYLVAQMRLLAAAGPRQEAFTDGELAGYLERHRERFAIPSFVRLTHVYLSADQRGAALEADARRLLTRLRAERISPAAAPALGDPFLLGSHTALSSRSDLERIYGSGMAAAVMRLPVGAWSGPVRSAQGMHLVWNEESREPEPAQLADVRSQIVPALAEERQEERLAGYLRRLRRQAAAGSSFPPRESAQGATR
jgi:hypothetical protein